MLEGLNKAADNDSSIEYFKDDLMNVRMPVYLLF